MNIVPYEEVNKMAVAITKSGMFGFKNENQAITLMLLAQSEGISPVSALQMYDIINGKPALKSTEVLSRFQKSGGKVEWIETNATVAKGKFTHPQGGSITISWDMERANKAQLTSKDNWKKHPDQMLRARCVTEAVRAIYPACLNNMHIADEIPENNLPDFQTSPQTDYEDAEIVEQPKLGTKQDLAHELRDLGLTKADMKAFGEKFEVTQEFIEECLTNRDFLIAKVKEFEDGSV